MSVLTDAHSRTLPKWNICVVRSTAFVFLCETVWIELLRFWEVSRVVVKSKYRDINPGTGWKCDCSSSSRCRQFVVAARYAIQKRIYRVLPHCLCEERNRYQRCEIQMEELSEFRYVRNEGSLLQFRLPDCDQWNCIL